MGAKQIQPNLDSYDIMMKAMISVIYKEAMLGRSLVGFDEKIIKDFKENSTEIILNARAVI